jgi:hypothetical protein
MYVRGLLANVNRRRHRVKLRYKLEGVEVFQHLMV